MNRLTHTAGFLTLAALLAATGCKPTPPPVVPAEGTVYLDGQPLPFAQVDFIPELKDFGAEMNSTAVTDENGKFVLKSNYQQQSGAAVGTHKVLVSEYVPDELRSMGAQQKLSVYQAKLKNRPIPEAYAVYIRTPLTVEVKAGQTTYDLQLSRRP
jgi:hypothetical protein